MGWRIRQRFPGGTIFPWNFRKGGRSVTIVPDGRLAVSDGHHAVRGAVEDVLGNWCPCVPGWYRYYPGRRHAPAAMRTFLNFIASRQKQ